MWERSVIEIAQSFFPRAYRTLRLVLHLLPELSREILALTHLFPTKIQTGKAVHEIGQHVIFGLDDLLLWSKSASYLLVDPTDRSEL